MILPEELLRIIEYELIVIKTDVCYVICHDLKVIVCLFNVIVLTSHHRMAPTQKLACQESFSMMSLP